MRRREFFTLMGGAAVAWPRVVRAQQADRMRRIGVLTVLDESDPNGTGRTVRVTQGLAELCWMDGRNLRIDVRWTGNDLNRMRMFVKELVGLQPDAPLVGSHFSPSFEAATQSSRSQRPFIAAPKLKRS